MNSLPTIVITGADGQLGRTFQALWPDSTLRGSYRLVCMNKAALDITDSAQLARQLNRHEVAAIVNAAAYTAVDAAEEHREQAFVVNERGAANLATWAAFTGCRLIHLSTDFVFDGRKGGPYLPEDEPAPLGVYGASKLAGERAVLERAPGALVLRTSWLYSPYGNNFVRTMLGLMRQRDSLKIVNDQVGSPTSTRSLTRVLLAILAEAGEGGIYHWSDGGVMSWYEFAVAIQEEALARGLLERAIPLYPIPTTEYPTPAQRPAYSVLDVQSPQETFACPAQNWRGELIAVLKELSRQREAAS